MDGFDPLADNNAADELSSVDKINIDYITTGVRNELAIAQEVATDVETDVAVSIAGCFTDGVDCGIDCQQCLSGVIQRQIIDQQSALDKVKAAIDKPIQNELSDAFATALNVGIPATDIIPGADSSDGFVAGNGQDLTPGTTDVTGVICPPGATPTLTGTGTIYCQPPDTTPVEPVSGGDVSPLPVSPTTPTSPITNLPSIPTQPFPGGVTSGGVTVAPSPIPVRPIPSPVASPPATNPTTGTPIQTAQPIPACVIPKLPAGAVITESHSLVGNSWFIGYRGKDGCDHWIQFGIFGNECTVEGSGDVAGCVPLPVQPPLPPIIPPESTGGDCVCPVPPATGGSGATVTVTSVPETIHPFCNPNALSTPDQIVRFRNPSQATRDTRLITLGSDLRTIANQPTGNDAMDALTSILSLPIVGLGYGVDFVVNGINTVVTGVADAAASGFGKIIELMVGIVSPYLQAADCQREEFAKIAAYNFLPSLIGFFGGAVPSQVTVPNVYSMNYLCPVLIPSGADLNALRAKGLITDSQWRTTIRANNLCPEWQDIIVDSLRTIPTPDQIQIAWRRGIIDDDAYDYYMKRNNILREEDANVYFKLTEFVPGPADLVRFMVRDAFDEQVATDLQLDKDFALKFSGRAKEWAEAQGMSEDQFKFFWRSHWQIPSYTQLTEALHRLPQDTPLPGGQGTAKAVTVDQVRRAIEINDMAPEWVDRLIAISYRVLSRVDARRAFEIGKLTEEELHKTYTDQGYTSDDADKLVEFARVTSLPKQAKQAGNASTAEVLQWYRDDLVPRDQAETLLVRSGVEESKVSNYLDTADLRKVTKARKEGIAALRKRWMTGEFNVGEATSQLNQLGVQPDRIGELLFNWSIVRDAKYKAPTVGMLCDWWTRGYITMDEFRRRCENLGYSLVDAERIVASCQGKAAERREKEAEKLAKEAESRQRRVESDRRRMVADQKRMEKEIKAALAAAAPCKPPPKPTCEANGQTP